MKGTAGGFGPSLQVTARPDTTRRDALGKQKKLSSPLVQGHKAVLGEINCHCSNNRSYPGMPDGTLTLSWKARPDVVVTVYADVGVDKATLKKVAEAVHPVEVVTWQRLEAADRLVPDMTPAEVMSGTVARSRWVLTALLPPGFPS